MKLAAIDIGSNAVRLLVSNIYKSNDAPIFKKESFVRVPLRLGEQAFTDGVIGEEKINKLVLTMKAFWHLMAAQDVLTYKAVATSAMREAQNSDSIIARVYEEAKIKIEVIDGKQESLMVFSNYIQRLSETGEEAYLSIDVGGGSTELTLFHKGVIVEAKSFKIGTLRLLNDQITEEKWLELRAWLIAMRNKYRTIYGLGSGGNINKMKVLYMKKNTPFMSIDLLENIYEHLTGFTILERIRVLGLKPDRADVIIPAAEIFMNIMKWGGISRMYIPKVGLADGIVRSIYRESFSEPTYSKS